MGMNKNNILLPKHYHSNWLNTFFTDFFLILHVCVKHFNKMTEVGRQSRNIKLEMSSPNRGKSCYNSLE